MKGHRGDYSATIVCVVQEHCPVRPFPRDQNSSGMNERRLSPSQGPRWSCYLRVYFPNAQHTISLI